METLQNLLKNKGNDSKSLKDLFKSKKLIVPSYQRAYSWEETQLKQFISDILEIGNKNYYFGHFILEEKSDSFEIIDGQQRITTFILFAMVCKLFGAADAEDYSRKFETVNYDQGAFLLIQNVIQNSNVDKEISISSGEPQTLSLKRILFALNYFKNLFSNKGKDKIWLDKSNINQYLNALTQAHVSTHITESKVVSVQIFELQNTRGIKLNLIEKVKSKLMKNIYLNSEIDKNLINIERIQNDFAVIYKWEESLIGNGFRGELTLEDVLFHHLRMVDDGTKLRKNDKNLFNSPIKYGNLEDVIIKYIDDQIASKKNEELISYITNLVAKFKESVELVCNILPNTDLSNPLIGDVLILDKSLSIEFFILLYHKQFQKGIEDFELIRFWEKLIFTRDFHDKYYRQWYRDDFERLFNELAQKDLNEVKLILGKYIQNGFRNELMENESLPETVGKYLETHKTNILNNAFNWNQEKMVYLLYKYEIKQNADFYKLRNIMKKGRSIEHILPQEWSWEWIGETDPRNISESGKNKNEIINSLINGIGNLLLISGNENSSINNSHPKTKLYKSCSGGSYDKHNLNKQEWENYENWESIINKRGETLFVFLREFVS